MIQLPFICKHQERIENKDIFSSPWEMMSVDERERVSPAPWMFRKKIVITYICSECGRRQTEKNQSMEGPA